MVPPLRIVRDDRPQVQDLVTVRWHNLCFGWDSGFATPEPLPPNRLRRLIPSEAAPLNDDHTTRQVTTAYLAAEQSWQGSDWRTSFGPLQLDLCGLKARQTHLLAEATSGAESEAWAAATRWLDQVERHAREARSAAASAIELCGKQQWAAALTRISEACELEAQYHQNLVWGPLRDLIAAAAANASAGRTPPGQSATA